MGKSTIQGSRTGTHHSDSRMEQSESLVVSGNCPRQWRVVSDEWRDEVGDEFGVRELAPALAEASLLAPVETRGKLLRKLATSNDDVLPGFVSTNNLRRCNLRRQQAAAEGRVENRKREQAPALQRLVLPTDPSPLTSPRRIVSRGTHGPPIPHRDLIRERWKPVGGSEGAASRASNNSQRYAWPPALLR
jgi:hypothetical protein